MDITKLLPSLPEWISLPIIVFAALVTLWPKITAILKELNRDSRAYASEKQRLELLKLRYEIEAIKKENGLEDIPAEAEDPSNIELEPETIHADEASTENIKLNFWGRFWFGVAGTAAPILLNLLHLDISQSSNIELSLPIILGISLRFVIFALLGGLGSAFLAKGNATKQTCFLIGLSISLLFSLLITANINTNVESPNLNYRGACSDAPYVAPHSLNVTYSSKVSACLPKL